MMDDNFIGGCFMKSPNGRKIAISICTIGETRCVKDGNFISSILLFAAAPAVVCTGSSTDKIMVDAPHWEDCRTLSVRRPAINTLGTSETL